jgi:hypothetical protein
MLVLHALFDRFRQISSNVETLFNFICERPLS